MSDTTQRPREMKQIMERVMVAVGILFAAVSGQYLYQVWDGIKFHVPPCDSIGNITVPIVIAFTTAGVAICVAAVIFLFRHRFWTFMAALALALNLSALFMWVYLIQTALPAAFASARYYQTMKDVSEIYHASVTFRGLYGRFPPAQTWFDELTASDKAVINKDRGISPDILTTNDPWGHPYVYRITGRPLPNTIQVYSMGADGITRTDGVDPDDISYRDRNGPNSCYLYTGIPISTRPRLIIPMVILTFLLADAFLSRLKKRNALIGDASQCEEFPLSRMDKMKAEGKRILVVKSAIVIYYVAALALYPSPTIHWPFSFLILFVGVPLFASLTGLTFHRNSSERLLSGFLFALAVIGLRLSTTPFY